ncbi:muconolactone Delta-isomerase family protein [Lentzea sp. JNUCC 0626]|uniref:muconolactone Delta-isomerase family protein n=1 Tax=Lentzea sp. JNUCC 0626 TaxID=3367513 RepID=UPI00374A8085
MTEFLVEITTAFPDLTESEVDTLRAAEAARAAELAASGALVRLWRPAGEKRSVGIWQATDEDDLRTTVLGSLPFRPYMTAIAVTALDPHPNDPGR